jgi:YD repeat-containing protein
MTDRDQWALRGPVHTCRIERTWGFPESGRRTDATALEFRPDGLLLQRRHHNPDGSQWTSSYRYDDAGRLLTIRHQNGAAEAGLQSYEYDSEGRLSRTIAADRLAESYEYDTAGRKKKVLYVDTAALGPGTDYSWQIEGTNTFYSAPGTARLETAYNDRDQPTEVSFHDAEGRLLKRIELHYDPAGNLVEEVQAPAGDVLPAASPDNLSPAQLETMRALLLVRNLHRYDGQGRRIETQLQMGPLGGDRTTFTYNDHGDMVSQIEEHEGREFSLDDDGQLLPVPDTERQTLSEGRIQYDYDERGNWVAKTMESRPGTDREFTVSSTERRAISYFTALPGSSPAS